MRISYFFVNLTRITKTKPTILLVDAIRAYGQIVNLEIIRPYVQIVFLKSWDYSSICANSHFLSSWTSFHTISFSQVWNHKNENFNFTYLWFESRGYSLLGLMLEQSRSNADQFRINSWKFRANSEKNVIKCQKNADQMRANAFWWTSKKNNCLT